MGFWLRCHHCLRPSGLNEAWWHPRMGDKPIWEQIRSSFIQHYYKLFDNNRTQLGAIYIDASCLAWEGQLPLWRTCLAFHSRKSSTAPRHRTISPRQIAASSVWLWASLRLTKTPSWGYQMFLLKNINNAWVCTNDISGLPCTTSADLLPTKHSCCFLLPPLPNTIHTPPDATNIIYKWAGPWWKWAQYTAAS